MESADCPLRATAGVRAGMPRSPRSPRSRRRPRSLMRPADFPSVSSLLVIGVGFACGCWLGSRWTPGDACWAVAWSTGKYLPLIAAPVMLGRWRGGGHRYGDRGGWTWSIRTMRRRKPNRS